MIYFLQNFQPFFRLYKAAIFVLLIPFFVVCFSITSHAAPRTQQELRAIAANIFKTGITYGDIPAIFVPKYMNAIATSMRLKDSDQVFVVFYPTGPKIYPQDIMLWHEVLNENIQGDPYIVTYAPITGSMVAYSSRLNDMDLTFDNQGDLYNNNSVLIDRQTGSLWLQILGMAFDGPLAGRGLNLIPAWWTTWKIARTLYPDAPVLAKPEGSKKPYGRDPYGSYLAADSYYFNDSIIYPLTKTQDRRMHAKTRILGFEHNNAFVAINEAAVAQFGFINFHVGLTPVLAVYDPRIAVVRVFNRSVWGKDALFKIENRKLVDVDTNSVWSFDGKALSGKLQGANLEEYFGITAFWFAWSAIHPETFIVPGIHDVPIEALIKGDGAKGLFPNRIVN